MHLPLKQLKFFRLKNFMSSPAYPEDLYIVSPSVSNTDAVLHESL